MVEERTQQLQYATFAGGCFWCMAPAFENIDGVQSVEVGFTGGIIDDPHYEQVCLGNTGHYEVVRVAYQESKCSYASLLYTYWKQIDPTDADGQFSDRGDSYKTAIFYHTEEQKKLAIESKEMLQKASIFADSIKTTIIPASPFFAADEYHQDYHKKNPEFYCQYRNESGRDQFLENIWKNLVFSDE